MKRLPYVSKYVDRHGKVRWRFRKSGHPETQTAASRETAEWWSWYVSALEGRRRPIGIERTRPGTFNALIVRYYESVEWKSLRPSTQETRKRQIERFRSQHGSKQVSHLKAEYITAMMDLKADHPGAANNLRRMLKGLMGFAVSRGWRKDNPADGVKKIAYRSGGFHDWSEDEIAAFEARWQVGTRERLAFDLLLHTGQRSGDVRIMTRSQVYGGAIRLRQQKTGEALVIPLHNALQASLDAYDSGQMVLLATQYGKPFGERLRELGDRGSAGSRSAQRA